MDAPLPSNPARSPSDEALDASLAAWPALLQELTELHARLEYLRLMLKLGVRSF